MYTWLYIYGVCMYVCMYVCVHISYNTDLQYIWYTSMRLVDYSVHHH